MPRKSKRTNGVTLPTRKRGKVVDGEHHGQSEGWPYNTADWKVTRKTYFEVYPFCIECKKAGLTVVATDLDHIHPWRSGGAVWDWDNLQGLCHTHHSSKSGKESQALRRGSDDDDGHGGGG